MSVDPLIGLQVGNYRITSLLGEGGMARVYRAMHPELGREVAIKVLSAEVAAMPDVVRRFRVEAQSVNKIDHPNIIHIFDFGTLPDGRQFYLMELLAGESLADRIKRTGALPLDESLEITDAVLDAVAAVHRAGIVHRDLKPDNIFLASSGGRRIVKLLDFGIVKLLGEQLAFDKTRTGSVLGTPSYMAPEQCLGKVSDIGPRTDLYAVGCILYVMLSGELPFNAESLGALMMQHMVDTPRPLTDRIRGLPLALSNLVQQCLAKEPQQRPESAAWLRQQLRTFVAQGPALAAAETIAAMAPQAPHALQTVAGTPVPVTPPTVPPSPAVGSPVVHTLPMSSIPVPQPARTERAAPRRWPLIAGAGVVALAAVGIVVALAARKPASPPAAAAVPIDAAEPQRFDAPVDAPVVVPDAMVDAQTIDATLVDATVVDAPPPSLTDRLESLKRMCDDGLFSATECKAKRDAILREWDQQR